jgi:hypothetical protein
LSDIEAHLKPSEPAAAMVVDIVKVVESTTLTEPPENWVALTVDNANAKGLGTEPWGLVGASLSG